MAPDKPHDNVWKHLLERKGLAAATSVLEEYGLSCEAEVAHLAEEDLGALTSKMRPLQSRLLRKWVECLAPVFSMFNPTFGEDQQRSFGDYLELAMQSQ